MQKVMIWILSALFLFTIIRSTDTGWALDKRDVRSDMVYIKGGTLRMGKSRTPFETQPATAIVSAFYIDKFEVSNADYKKFIDATNYPAPFLDPEKYPWARPYNWINRQFPPGADALPVVLVSWHDAVAYAKWRGKKLPTEVQWELAARTEQNLAYPWGNQWDSTRCNTRAAGPGTAVTVNSYESGISKDGLHHLVGNVMEWCADWYAVDSNPGVETKDPIGPEKGATRVVRGGSWKTISRACLRGDARESFPPSARRADLGFRCVLD
jgi:formylglycine-generating enzyme required for sulfatase activity